jgi:hypothetical protein
LLYLAAHHQISQGHVVLTVRGAAAAAATGMSDSVRVVTLLASAALLLLGKSIAVDGR